jgi:hypothetical protein
MITWCHVMSYHGVHAIIGGIYLYDLGSQHGSFINKKVIAPKTYAELKVGDIVRILFISSVVSFATSFYTICVD